MQSQALTIINLKLEVPNTAVKELTQLAKQESMDLEDYAGLFLVRKLQDRLEASARLQAFQRDMAKRAKRLGVLQTLEEAVRVTREVRSQMAKEKRQPV